MSFESHLRTLQDSECGDALNSALAAMLALHQCGRINEQTRWTVQFDQAPEEIEEAW